MHQTFGFVNSSKPKHVCLLRRSLYGLKQASRAWYHCFATYLLSLGFMNSKSDSSLFIFHRDSEVAYLLLYVDDIILTCSFDTLRQKVNKLLSSEFAMKDLGSLSYFLGIAITRTLDTMFLCQQKYAREILARADMSSCKATSTPVDAKSKLSVVSGKHVTDPTSYRRFAGALQYLTITRPDLSYAVQQICLFMHDPREQHFQALKKIFRYNKGTLSYGLHFISSPAYGLVSYSDVDWGG